MRQINGIYTQFFNRKHQRVGHVFQNRYKAIVVVKNEHLLEFCRYLVLNRVKTGMIKKLKEWQLSSYHTTLYDYIKSDFLSVEWILGKGERSD